MTATTEATIEADQTVPDDPHLPRLRGDPGQLFRAHTDPELFARWVGPAGHRRRHRPLGRPRRRRLAFRFRGATATVTSTAFRGCFHTVRPDRIVQTFTWEGMPDGVALETMTFEDLGDGRTRLHATSRCATASRRATRGCAAAWRSGSTTATPPSTGCSPMAPSELLTAEPARRHRLIADGFARRVHGRRDWSAAAPVEGWAARDVVVHLVEWLPRFLQGGSDVSWPDVPSPNEDPAGAWDAHADRRTGAPRRPREGRRRLHQPAHRLDAARRRRSTASTPPTCSCTPGTWPEPPARTTARPRAVRGDAGRDGAARRAPPELRPVRSGRPGARGCRPSDATARVHRPRSRLGARDAAVTPTLHKCLDIYSNVRSNRRTPKRY